VKRAWGLFFAGLGNPVLAATFAVPPLLLYGEHWSCDDNPNDDFAPYGGRPCAPSAFERWISEPGIVAFLAVSLTLLLVALVVMRRGLKLR
jgi:hypothetical protein